MQETRGWKLLTPSRTPALPRARPLPRTIGLALLNRFIEYLVRQDRAASR